MCGLYFSTSNETGKLDKKFLLRGPDFYYEESGTNSCMSHSLLSLTGEFTPQPITVNNVKLIFNGQIYNYDKNKFLSDSYFIIDKYLEFHLNFWEKLDGEYAIVIYDEVKNLVLFITDIFGTKPLYYSLENNEISISSLKSSLVSNGHKKIIKCSPNTIYTYNLNSKKLVIKENYFKFNLDQYKENFDGWNQKFHESILKRFDNLKHDIILPLSSGHDSGAIACAFHSLNIDFYSYSFINNENRKILIKRLLSRFGNSPLKAKFKNNLNNQKIKDNMIEHMEKYADEFLYGDTIENLYIDGKKDPGSIGLSYILDKSKKINKNIKIVASGQGGDEIYSNNQSYTFGLPNPKKFDNNLEKIFPWQNFFFGSQLSYLSKEESIGGSFGLETRYPFLDKSLVQEYLNLKPELKNKYYKSPITNYLMKFNYPFIKDSTKVGFSP